MPSKLINNGWSKNWLSMGLPTWIPPTAIWLMMYLPAYNAEFMHPTTEEGSVFVSWADNNLDDILCEQHERTVSADNCVSFEGLTLQIPANRYRCHYVRVRVRVHRYIDGSLAIFHGPRKLADYDHQGRIKELKKAA